MSKKIDAATLKPVIGTMYPPPFDAPCLARERTRLGDAAGLTQFGVNSLHLPPGARSSQRHWQTEYDEFVSADQPGQARASCRGELHRLVRGGQGKAPGLSRPAGGQDRAGG